MIRIRHITLSIAVILACSVAAPAQEFILPYLKTPETPAEFWAAFKYERHLGNYKRATQMLGGMWAKIETLDADARKKFLLGLHDAEKMSTFLQIDRIPELAGAVVKDAEGKDVRVSRLLVEEVNRHVEERVGNVERIKQFIANLSSKVKEERDYALYQLRLSGYRAVPYMLEAYRDKNRPQEHVNIYNAWVKMDSDICPPLYAAMATTDARLRSDLIRLFLERGDNRTVRAGLMPILWYWHGKGELAATDALTRFLSDTAKLLPADKLADPRAMLVAEAEAYYRHLVPFTPNVKHFIWQLDEKENLIRAEVVPTQIEEYYGALWARSALDLDAEYEPAQIVLVSLMIEKASERGGIDPELGKLLGSLDTQLIEKVLARAMADKRDAVARGALAVLLPVGEKRLVRPDREPPPVVRALKHPDRNVQLLAAETILLIPTETFAEGTRVVKILGRAFAAEAEPRAIVASGDLQDARDLETIVKKWGYKTRATSSAAELVRDAAASADVELIVLDASLSETGLLQLLSQMRTDPDLAGIPVLLLGTDKTDARTLNEAAKYDRVRVVSPRPAGEAMLTAEHDQFFADLAKRMIFRLNNDQRLLLSTQASKLLRFLAASERKGFDLRPLDDRFYSLLARDTTAPVVAEILAVRTGPKGNERKSQEALANVAANVVRDRKVRLAALSALRNHIQRWGLLLAQDKINQLIQLPDSTNDPELKAEAYRLAVILKPDPKSTGTRLRDFQPGPAPEPMP